MILWAQSCVFPCKGCTVLIDSQYPDSLNSNNWSLLMGSIRNAASCLMIEISSACTDEDGSACRQLCLVRWCPACHLLAQALYMLSDSSGSLLCWDTATRNISRSLPFWFPGRGMCRSILISTFNLHLKGFHHSCFQPMLFIISAMCKLLVLSRSEIWQKWKCLYLWAWCMLYDTNPSFDYFPRAVVGLLRSSED